MDGSIALFMWSQPAINTDGPVSGPGPRAAHSCDLIGNKLYVFGGWNGKKVRKRGVHGDGSAVGGCQSCVRACQYSSGFVSFCRLPTLLFLFF